MWTLLLVTLPTRPTAVRLRVWRALKSLGGAALRDGAHLLPRPHADLFTPLVADVRSHGGQAVLVDATPRDDTQQAEWVALFDRSDGYARWRGEADALAKAIPTLAEPEARRRLRAAADALLALQRIDFFAGEASLQADDVMGALRAGLDARFSKGEPTAEAPHGIARLDRKKFQGRRWATRSRPWVDRLACAWLIRRFVDTEARFLWLDDPGRAPRGSIGFDHDGARFTHVGNRVTFEVMAASFGLDADTRLQRIARAVHYLDVGGIPAPEAAGLEAVLSGMREVHTDDDRLAQAATGVFDALHAAPESGR